jgi:hypothetical protein
MVNWSKAYRDIIFPPETKETEMGKFVAMVPPSGTKGQSDYNWPRMEDFHSADAAKVWAGRQLLANPEVGEVNLYRLESSFRIEGLITDHVKVVDRR